MILRFEVQGSQAEPYVVVIKRMGTQLTATCDCQAGQKAQACKHRTSLFLGSDKGVVGGDVGEIANIPELLEGTNLSAALAEIDEAEAELDIAKKKVAALKKKLGKVMLG